MNKKTLKSVQTVVPITLKGEAMSGASKLTVVMTVSDGFAMSADVKSH